MRTAARVVGVSIILMILTAFAVGDLLLDNLIIPGDAEQLALDIEADPGRFMLATGGYVLLLLIDAVIAVSLYVVLRPADRVLAFWVSGLRLLYTVISLANVALLIAQVVGTESYGAVKLLAYVCFIAHLLVLGRSVWVSGYLPRLLGALLILGALSYVPAFFLGSLVPNDGKMIFALFMMVGEAALGLWLLARSSSLDERVENARPAEHSGPRH